MEEFQFLKSVADDIRKALNAGGYRDIEFFDENLVAMNGPSGENIDGEETVARLIKPVSEHDIIVSLAPEGDGKYTILVTLDKNVDFTEFDEKVGKHLKRLGGTWGSRLEYDLQTLGREIKSKDELKTRVRGNIEEDTMNSHLSEKAAMTGTTRSSYQKIGECKVIIRHSNKVNEEKTGARSRNIDAIFIETKGGERFRMAENNLHGARAMARHLSNGGSPFDVVGNKVTEMMSDMATLREMAKDARTFGKNRVLSEEQSKVVTDIRSRYIGLRESLKKMAGKLGYMRHSVMEYTEMPSDKMLGRGPHAGQGYSGAPLPVSGKSEPTQNEIIDAVNANPRKYGLDGQLRYETEYWDRPEFAAYKNAKAELMGLNEFELASDKMLGGGAHAGKGYSSAPLPTSGKKVSHADVVAAVNANPRKYGQEGHMRFETDYWDQMEFDAFKRAKAELEKMNESMEVKSKSKKAEEKKKEDTVLVDQTPVYDRPTDGRFPELTRDADNMHSVNEEKYGKAPEEVMLESWFDEASTVEFFNEEELVVEDAIPTIEKTLPENALGMLNMYVDHPLFNHYMKTYETQEILDDVLALVEEGSTLCENITTTREKMKEFANYGTDTMSLGRGEHPSEGGEVTNFDEAVNKINSLISDRRLNLENAINQVAKEIVGEDQTPESLEEVVDQLWGLSEEAGLVKHDFGSTFSDQVLAPNETVSAHSDEIDAEEFYGDARFAESDDSAEDEVIDEQMEPESEDSVCAQCGEPFFVDEYGVSHHIGDTMDGVDHDADGHHVPYGMDDHDDGQPTDYEEYQDYMGGDDWDHGQYDEFEEMNQVRRNAGLEPLVREMNEGCSCGCPAGQCNCGPECACGCNALSEGDPFGRQSKRNLANPKARMSLINPEDKISSSTLGEDDVDEAAPRRPNSIEDKMHDRMDRSGYGDRVKQDKPKGEKEDKYAKMARERGIDANTGNRKPKYEAVEMPHHLPAKEKPEGTLELSEDGARIIELSRFRK